MHHSHYIIPTWPAPQNVRAASTTRINGHSIAPFDSFNLGNHTGDDPQNVALNRQQLSKELELINAPVWLNQVHGKEVVCIDDLKLKSPQADAAFTSQPNHICIILTADCLPIFLCDKSGNKVAAIHAGWRGLCAGVIEETIKAMQIPGKELLAWLGPAIGPTKFEVGEEVRQQFLAADKEAQPAFVPANHPDKWLANLYLLAKQRLQKMQVNAIYGGDLCTYTDKESFYSYRRDQGKTGRMASLICLT